jgi:hypothetical protein
MAVNALTPSDALSRYIKISNKEGQYVTPENGGNMHNVKLNVL